MEMILMMKTSIQPVPKMNILLNMRQSQKRTLPRLNQRKLKITGITVGYQENLSKIDPSVIEQFSIVSKVISRLLWYCITMLCDWL